jgi:hypothetical protein
MHIIGFKMRSVQNEIPFLLKTLVPALQKNDEETTLQQFLPPLPFFREYICLRWHKRFYLFCPAQKSMGYPFAENPVVFIGL